MIWREVKKHDIYKNDPEFRKAIDDAFSKAEPAGTRHRRPKRRVKLAKEAFNETAGIQSLAQEKGPGDIILGYLVDQKGQRVEKDNRRNARNSTLTRTSNIHHSQHQFTLKLQ